MLEDPGFDALGEGRWRFVYIEELEADGGALPRASRVIEEVSRALSQFPEDKRNDARLRVVRGDDGNYWQLGYFDRSTIER